MILGFDTATATPSVAVVNEGELLSERSVPPGPDGRPRHSSDLLGAIEACVAAGGGWEQIRRIAVGLGPGSFTGLRIGISTARALAQGHGLELAGVGSLDALVAGAEPAAAQGETVPVGIIDARRGQVFAQVGARGEGAGPSGAGPVTPGELAAQIARLDRRALAVGDGAVRFRLELEAADALVPADDEGIHLVAGREICALGSRVEVAADGQIEPLYLREPDADLWRKRDQNRRTAG